MIVRTTRGFSSRPPRAAAVGLDGCLKMKAVFLFFFFLTLLTIITVTLKAVPSSAPAAMQPPLHQHSSLHSKGYTILMNTWKRNDLLVQSISHYSSCRGLASIHVVWSEPDPPPPSLTHRLKRAVRSRSPPANGKRVELKFDINAENSLNNRFKEVNGLQTDGVFSVDDDVIIPCSSVALAFDAWRSAPDAMVGFVPRVHHSDDGGGINGERYKYGGWWSVWWMGRYSMVLSKAAFFHNKYLSLYTHQMPPSIRNYVTKNRNCEDIAMSFLVANETNAPPIRVKYLKLGQVELVAWGVTLKKGLNV
ncbi:unnamed protein product [Cuscuta campestris]|uniref:Glycosyl transferase 64 domain-containing protein n=1 Tax=Cuscuta campestris TaxID=132261 RepID=A0A484LVV6_9ASTE|nr:unnamed protein product [Cuscuta campestris]